MDLNDLYRDVIVDHNRNPRNFRPMPDATCSVEGDNPLCGDRLRLYLRLEGGLPLLPSTSSTLQSNMLSNREYVKRILDMNARMTTLVAAAQAQGVIDPELPADVVVFALYARTCDPAVEYLRMTGHYTNQQVIDYLVRVAFAGLRGGR